MTITGSGTAVRMPIIMVTVIPGTTRLIHTGGTDTLITTEDTTAIMDPITDTTIVGGSTAGEAVG